MKSSQRWLQIILWTSETVGIACMMCMQGGRMSIKSRLNTTMSSCRVQHASLIRAYWTLTRFIFVSRGGRWMAMEVEYWSPIVMTKLRYHCLQKANDRVNRCVTSLRAVNVSPTRMVQSLNGWSLPPKCADAWRSLIRWAHDTHAQVTYRQAVNICMSGKFIKVLT